MSAKDGWISTPRGKTMAFDFERTAKQVGYRLREFKRFLRFIATYDDGHVLIGRAYPDGHFEYKVKVI